MIPQFVLEVLAAIRAGGSTNMLDRDTVIEIADVMDENAADWLRLNKSRYADALNQMGTMVHNEPKGDEE